MAVDEEGRWTKNFFLYRFHEKFYVGPPWDLDSHTFMEYRTKFFFIKPSGFYYRLLFNDPYFVSRVKERWKKYRLVWKQEIPSLIDSYYEVIHKAAERNERMWPDWSWLYYYPEKPYKELITEMKNAFMIQLEWMDAEIEKM